MIKIVFHVPQKDGTWREEVSEVTPKEIRDSIEKLKEKPNGTDNL
jgi:hypothetical protein